MRILAVLFAVLLFAVPAFAEDEKSSASTAVEVTTDPDLAERLTKILCEEGLGEPRVYMPDGSCPAIEGP